MTKGRNEQLDLNEDGARDRDRSRDPRSQLLYRDDFEDALARIKYIETKLGIESGK